MADYWAKVYIEILDDPKMATMPDRLWRRTIELFLLAKKFNQEGHLPETKQLAWLLRMQTDDLDLDLKQIGLTGIIQPEPAGWFIVKFAERQAASTPAERKRQQRDREHSQQYYGNVTEQSRNVTQRTENRLTETETETEGGAPDPFINMQRVIETATGFPQTPRDIPAIDEFVEKGIIADDIKGAMEFLISVGKTPRGAADMRGSVMVAHGKRIQSPIGKKSSVLAGMNFDNGEG